MANFFFGNYANSADITFINNAVNYTAQIEVTQEYDPIAPNDTVKIYDVPLGVLTDIDVSKATAVKAICKPLLGFKFTKAHRSNNSTNREIPFSAELMEFSFTRDMWEFTTNNNPRKIGMITGVSETYKDFMFGNYSTGTGVISQNGEPTYKAYVNVTTATGIVINEIPLGVKTAVNVLGATSVNVRCEPITNNQFISVRTGGGSVTIDVPYSPNLIDVELTQAQWQASGIDRRQFVIRTESVATRIFYFGNSTDATGRPIKTGNNSFTGVVTLYGNYDPSEETYPEKVYYVESGTELEIALTPEFNSGNIELTIVDGYKFIGVNFPYEATFTNNTVSYEFPDYDYDDIPEDKEELDPSDEMNRYYVAMTESTGNPDPEPSDEPSTIANNYLLTKSELEVFNTEMFNALALEETLEIQTLITEYLCALRVYPFIIPSDNLYNRGNIKIKRNELNVATIINSDVINIDLGNIEVTRLYDNALDFTNVKCDLILPFIKGSVSIDPEYVIGQKVNINFKINIVSGNITINLKSNKIDMLFDISSDSIGADYPLYNRTNVIQKEYNPIQAINTIRQAYVIIETPIYTTTDIKSRKEGLLTDVKGDVIIDDIKLNILATSDEKDLLQFNLKNGVFIK